MSGNDPTKRDPYLDPDSVENRFRKKRFAIVEQQIEEALQTTDTIRILDIGGTEKYWLIARHLFEKYPGRIRIDLVNMESATVSDPEIFTHHIADACDPELFAGQQFDLVHSNSVIEHVGDWYRMGQFAANVQRLGKRYYIQTPNYWFPVEPHFRFVGYHWLPVFLRTWLLTHYPLGFFPKENDRLEARKIVDSIRLLTRGEVKLLFADAKIQMENVLGLNKSILAYR